MKKIVLTAKEQEKYETIENLVKNNGNKDEAAEKLGCTKRHINRMILGYKEKGKAFFSHGNKGRKPATAISKETRKEIVHLYRRKYKGTALTRFTKLLSQNEGIDISVVSVTKILEDANIYSPTMTKNKKNRIRNKLLNEKEQAKGKTEAKKIERKLAALEKAHPKRKK